MSRPVRSLRRIKQIAAATVVVRTALPILAAIQTTGLIPCLPREHCNFPFQTVGRPFVVILAEAALVLVCIANGSRVALFIAAALEALTALSAEPRGSSASYGVIFLYLVVGLSISNVILLCQAAVRSPHRA